jgi:hypothetical protein
MTTSPMLVEFKETVRDAFAYLGREFAFRETEPPSSHLEVNPFIVWFANGTTLVQVEGINCGFAAHVALGPVGSRDEHVAVPLWAVIKHRRPRGYAAVAAAADAFRAGDFRRVVEFLMPHMELLTAAERAKLSDARAHIDRDHGAA